jgi:F0F1-type ATP synthase membrane subunit b/b'
MVQQILVVITFLIASVFLLKKFVWSPIFENKKKKSAAIDGANTKCGKKDCACH